MNVIRSHVHDVYTEEANKVALSAEDDKRVIMEDGIYTLAYGHYRLKKLKEEHTRGGEKYKICIFYISVPLFPKESTYL